MAQVTYSIKEERTERKRGLLLILLTGVLVLSLVGGSTLAYLTATTNTANNVFTAGNISAELSEAQWDAGGKTAAATMLPGQTAAKDPVITNTSLIDEGEWVAIKLTFQKALVSDPDDADEADWQTMNEAELTNLLTGIGVGTTSPTSAGAINVSSDWTAVTLTGYNNAAGTRAYLYNSVLDQTDSTNTPLFSYVTLSAAAGSEEWESGDTVTSENFMSWLGSSDGCNGHYRIVVEGGAVQETGVANTTAATPILMKLLGYTTS